jgi:hypothetical protein
MPRVVRIFSTPDRDHTKRIDRATQWGNPFILHDESMRDEVCDAFEEYARHRLLSEPDWLEPLRGYDLACWCAPKRCHGDTILKLLAERNTL